MKTTWSALFLSLLLLVTACGKEQFGTASQKENPTPPAVDKLTAVSCSNLTLINPEVDILYVVDNSTSSYVVPAALKTAIKQTINTVSDDFDYRVIGTPLLETAGGNQDFQVLPKNSSSLPAAFNGKKVATADEFSFFSNSSIVSGSQEPGLRRIRDFLTAHTSDGLFRQNAYLFIILVSNGRDTEIEVSGQFGNGESVYASGGQTIYNNRLTELKQIKSALNSRQFRLFSITASTTNSNCSGFTSMRSYVQMSKDLYNFHTPQLDDQTSANPDHYNLCGDSVSNVYNSVNNSIKKIVIPHTYKYWPVTFTTATGIDPASVKVFKSTTNSAQSVELPRGIAWNLVSNPGSTNTRILPTPGEPTTAPNLVEFTDGNEIVYPNCVTVTSDSNREYFKAIVLTKPAVTGDPNNPIVVRINGVDKSSCFTYRGYVFDQNIKVAHNGYLATPEQRRTGYFLETSTPSCYYQSGDSVDVGFKPAGI